MLKLPEVRFARSIQSHNVNFEAAADWLEGSALFYAGEVSKIEVKDYLLENEIYDDQDFAAEFLQELWSEFSRRERISGDCWPLRLESEWLRARSEWQERPEYSFCLLVSLQLLYRTWARELGSNFTDQGELFERLVEESLARDGWSTLRTGWSRTEPVRLQDVVRMVSDHAGERTIPGGVEHWTPAKAKEAGLDVLCLKRFVDGNGGRPLFLFQCASGGNWPDKQGKPNLRIWDKLVDFSNSPQRGLAIPFALSQEEFRHCSAAVDGFVLDRYRLLSRERGADRDFPSGALREDLRAWVAERVHSLPKE